MITINIRMRPIPADEKNETTNIVPAKVGVVRFYRDCPSTFRAGRRLGIFIDIDAVVI